MWPPCLRLAGLTSRSLREVPVALWISRKRRTLSRLSHTSWISVRRTLAVYWHTWRGALYALWIYTSIHVHVGQSTGIVVISVIKGSSTVVELVAQGQSSQTWTVHCEVISKWQLFLVCFKLFVYLLVCFEACILYGRGVIRWVTLWNSQYL